MTLHLQKKNWRDFIRSDNPVSAALLSAMGYKKEEKIQVKKEFLRMMTRMELDPAKQRLIYSFFETYLTLSKEEEEELMAEIGKFMDVEEIMELPISYEEKGKELGKKEVAIEMLKEGSSLEFISKVTKLSRKEIGKLKKQL